MELKKLKRGQELKLTISDIAFGGQGISKVDDRVFFVKDAIPNQKIIARISKVKKKYVEAFKIQILKQSKDEIDPKCNHFKYCGGCTLQQLNYEKQIYYKQQQVYDILSKIGEIKNPKINDIIPCEKTFYYRNKMEYTFSNNPWYIDNETYDDVIIGLHVPKRFDKILSIDKCYINDPIFNELNASIKNKAKVATNSFPTTAAGTKFLDFADLIVIAPTARPIAVINPKISPYKLPNLRESKKI